MNTAITIWIAMAVICTAAFFYRVANSIHHNVKAHRRQRIIEIGRESEEFFVPGDRIIKDVYDYDCDD